MKAGTRRPGTLAARVLRFLEKRDRYVSTAAVRRAFGGHGSPRLDRWEVWRALMDLETEGRVRRVERSPAATFWIATKHNPRLFP